MYEKYFESIGYARINEERKMKERWKMMDRVLDI